MSNFREIWMQKPRREGANPPKRAERAYNARIKEGINADDILRGVMRYHAYCEKKGIAGGPYVMQMATFLGPDRHFELDWEIKQTQEEAFRSRSIEEELGDRSWAH